MDDEIIRDCIAEQFISTLLHFREDSIVAFFNLTFDLSQFLKYLVTKSGLECVNEYVGRIKKGQLNILETDRKVYMVQFRSHLSGYRTVFIDCMHFAPSAGGLDKVAYAWVGEHKIELESKIFPKQAPTKLEKEYAMKDAKLTRDLYIKMVEQEVIENRIYTIAGRTMKHFKQFCHQKYGIDMMNWLYQTDDKDLIL